jgi:thiosulfate/3-mercaptopyruvate sulfurtransferase
LKYNLERKGITRDKEIIVYCQSGSRSSHTAFVLKELLDYPNVRNYDGSWIEWSYYNSKDNSIPNTQISSENDCKRMEFELMNKFK